MDSLTQCPIPKKLRWTQRVLTGIIFFISVLSGTSQAEQNVFTAEIFKYPYDLDSQTVVGQPRLHQVKQGESLLDIARTYGLGYNEMALLYPRMDPWLPPKQKSLIIPTLWVLPPTRLEELVINIPELRLYLFDKKSKTVQTYPIGIGDEGWETPIKVGYIAEKRPNPSWYIPESLQAKYGMKVMPPGPENPLGEYMLKLSIGPYGIHGTHMPWGVGRLVSHGCIRCYPEHIRLLYPQVAVGTRVEIIYEPLKLGIKNGRVYVEAHPDVYRKIDDYTRYAMEKLDQSSWASRVDRRRFALAVRLQNGVPTDVSTVERVPSTTLAEDAGTLKEILDFGANTF
ncbi:L,D-transpeptidase family protein [Desulfosoma caldarium]|uniref:L,D-transpeptidase ErfK/SrfK n=1 Tax=Desulfosoma caldarium TaxID=610254 RepID=A0A3N1VTC8_9BACT|nr:L,D-transpeptidase family protein [Desulfosoma caldarium]ROR03097.1 L,D-transpeptidase ErfK/SrfK [Desulfosoma caldarium]